MFLSVIFKKLHSQQASIALGFASSNYLPIAVQFFSKLHSNPCGYLYLSPCEKCMDIIKEFAENCKTGTTITIVYKEVNDILIDKKPRKNTIRLFNLEELKSRHTKAIPMQIPLKNNIYFFYPRTQVSRVM